MEPIVLNDKEIYPTEEVIFSHIGKSQKYWKSLFNFIHEEHPDFTEEWRFYKDGGAWLLKVQKKSKTVFWLSVFKNYFSITFYFTDKAEDEILNSTISDELKSEFKNGKHFGKLRALTILFKKNIDVDFAKTVIDIKLRLK